MDEDQKLEAVTKAADLREFNTRIYSET